MKILYILSSYNKFGGTPKKTLDLLNEFGNNASLYVYSKTNIEFKEEFINSDANIYEGDYGSNYFKHLNRLIKIIDNDKIEIVQTQFSMGETLAFLIKLFRPKIKVVCAFVGPFKPTIIKSKLISFFYRKFDVFVYISEYVKSSKENQFSILKSKQSIIIPNGSEKRIDTGEPIEKMSKFSLLDIAGLVDWKNVKVLLDAMNILVNKKHLENIFLYVAGDGPEKQNLENLIIEYNLKNKVILLGYQKNIGRLLDTCDIFVHPAYAEGFGIVIPEAMHASKPIIVSNAGALPELIEHEKTGLIVDPFKPQEWADAIERLINDENFATKLALSAKAVAKTKYTKEMFCDNYLKLYNSILKHE
tara:strand:+ start:842 stop:1921 length:1080 start_codon:yes stop_codon:yes gene_type:complete